MIPIDSLPLWGRGLLTASIDRNRRKKGVAWKREGIGANTNRTTTFAPFAMFRVVSPRSRGMSKS